MPHKSRLAAEFIRCKFFRFPATQAGNASSLDSVEDTSFNAYSPILYQIRAYAHVMNS